MQLLTWYKLFVNIATTLEVASWLLLICIITHSFFYIHLAFLSTYI